MIFNYKSGSRIRYDALDALQNLLDLDFLALLSCSHILVSSEESSNGLLLGPEGTTIGQSCLSSLQVYSYYLLATGFCHFYILLSEKHLTELWHMHAHTGTHVHVPCALLSAELMLSTKHKH